MRAPSSSMLRSAAVQGLPDSWAAISVRRLLTHTSGLPDYGRVISDWDRPQSRELIIDAIGTCAAVVRSRHRLGLQQHQLRGAGMVDRSHQRTVVCRLPASSVLGPAALLFARVDSAGDVIPDRAGALRPYQRPLRACRAVETIGISRGRWRRSVFRSRHRTLVDGARQRAFAWLGTGMARATTARC